MFESKKILCHSICLSMSTYGPVLRPVCPELEELITFFIFIFVIIIIIF